MNSIKKEKHKSESIIPIGFYQYNKSHSVFCKIEEHPKKIFIIPGNNKDFNHFSEYKEVVVFKNGFLKRKIKLENVDNIIFSRVNNKNIITFNYKRGANNYLYWAISTKDNKWLVQGKILNIKEKGGIISDYTYNKNHFIYFGEKFIHSAFSSDFKKWKNNQVPVLKSRPGFFDSGDLKFISSKVTKNGILVFYDASVKHKEKIKIQIGLVMFSLLDPNKIIWRADEPIFQEEIPFENGFECKGTIFSEDKVVIYWYSKNNGMLSSSLFLPFSAKTSKDRIKILKRHCENPIISPKIINNKEWMSEGAFNPAAIVIKDKTHLLFRAVGNDGISRVGHSCSYDGVNFDKIHPEPVFYLKRSHFGNGPVKDKYDPVMYPSGGSWGGCEDPRLVKVDDMIYMTFNAFDGWDFIRVGYTSIKEKDFEKENWNWSKPKLISPLGQINKNWVIFPEKINGKFAILHSLTPEIQIDYVDKLENLASGEEKINSIYGKKVPRRTWDTWLRGAGPPPIKTEDGWLVFYHAISAEETSKYKLGVMLLDINNPKKILARSSSPILLPDMWYENDSKPGVVYACGAVVKEDTLFVYYGGGDKFVCVATVPFKDFIKSLKNITERVPFISKVIFS
jgi:beta-1,2-mannobiose phosphorylase / 1,2-beta-oligomannan phosphorylase